MSSIYRSVSGYCPYLDAEYSIDVRYAEISLLRQSPEYRRIDFDCDELESCPNNNDCPIYNDAPITII